MDSVAFFSEDLLAFGEHVSDFGHSRRRRCISLARSICSSTAVRESASIICDNVGRAAHSSSPDPSAMPLFQEGKRETNWHSQKQTVDAKSRMGTPRKILTRECSNFSSLDDVTAAGKVSEGR